MKYIYSPEEDSFLLSSVMKKRVPEFLLKKPKMKFLEIGSGSGIQLKNSFQVEGQKAEHSFL